MNCSCYCWQQCPTPSETCLHFTFQYWRKDESWVQNKVMNFLQGNGTNAQKRMHVVTLDWWHGYGQDVAPALAKVKLRKVMRFLLGSSRYLWVHKSGAVWLLALLLLLLLLMVEVMIASLPWILCWRSPTLFLPQVFFLVGWKWTGRHCFVLVAIEANDPLCWWSWQDKW